MYVFINQLADGTILLQLVFMQIKTLFLALVLQVNIHRPIIND